MNKISNAHITDYKKIKKKLMNFDSGNSNFYSDFKEGLFYYILRRKCYLISGTSSFQAVIIFKSLNREIIYLPASSKHFSFFRLLFYLNKYFIIKDYTLKLKYKKLNAENYKKYFSYNIVNDFKIMQINTKLINISSEAEIPDDNCSLYEVKVRLMELDRDEAVRVKLQNSIFSNVIGRRELTVEEVIREESRPGFIKNMCYIVEVDGMPAGYGQILILDEKFYLVNFGISEGYRQKGLGYYFLIQILDDCHRNGIETLYLSVDNNNVNALKLYKKAGFDEVYNMITIKF